MSDGPRPFDQHHASTLFLRVPASEWGAIRSGAKTEFRASGRGAAQMHRVKPPTPVVAYRVNRQGHEGRLMVLEETWQEPLGAISPESLQREGQPDLAHFRRYWIARTKRHFTPTRMVVVFRVRPWAGEGDEEFFAHQLLERLYGEWF